MIYVWLAVTGFLVGNLGAILGLGGGVFLLPVLTLFFHMPIQRVVAASLVAVIATSGVASVRYLRDGLTNIGLAMLLEIATTSGAIGGGLVAAIVAPRDLALLFAVVALYTAGHMVLGREVGTSQTAATVAEPPAGRLAEALRGEYKDALAGGTVRYRPRRIGPGLGGGIVAGAISGLLGIGGGPVKVPLMVLLMGVPTRAAAATSNLMVGITAAASAFIYLRNGQLDPPITGVLALTVMAGAATGTKISYRLKSQTLRVLFSVILAGLAVEMALRGLQGGL